LFKKFITGKKKLLSFWTLFLQILPIKAFSAKVYGHLLQNVGNINFLLLFFLLSGRLLDKNVKELISFAHINFKRLLLMAMLRLKHGLI